MTQDQLSQLGRNLWAIADQCPEFPNSVRSSPHPGSMASPTTDAAVEAMR